MRRLVLSFALAVVTTFLAGSVEAGCIIDVHGSFSAYRCDDGSAGRSDDLGRLPPEASRVIGARGGLGYRDIDDGVGLGWQPTLPKEAARAGAGERGWVKARPW